MIQFIKRHPISILLSIFLHVSIVVFFSIQWKEKPQSIKVSLHDEQINKIDEIKTPKLEPMQTFAVDSSRVQAKLDKLKAEQEAKLEEQKQLKQLTEKERKRLKELQKKQEAEKAKAEKAKKLAAEQKRKAEAERKKVAEAKRLAAAEKKKAEAEKKKAEAAKLAAQEAEKKRLQEKKKADLAEKKRKEEEKKKQQLEKELAKKAEEKKALEKAAAEAKKQKQKQEAEAELQKKLAEEAAAQRAAQKKKQLLSLRETYISSITAKVKDNWRTPARISPNAQCDLKITQSPSGNITSVKVLNCNKEATRQFQQAAEKAVYRSEPLPKPPVKELFERVIIFEFKP